MSTTNQRATQLAVAAVLIDAAGAAVARRTSLVGEPFGIKLPVAVPAGVELVAWGSATSAPVVMDVAAVYLARRSLEDSRWAKAMIMLGLARMVGVACEPATWGRRHSRAAMAMAPCHVALAASQVAAGIKARRR